MQPCDGWRKGRERCAKSKKKNVTGSRPVNLGKHSGALHCTRALHINKHDTYCTCIRLSQQLKCCWVQNHFIQGMSTHAYSHIRSDSVRSATPPLSIVHTLKVELQTDAHFRPQLRLPKLTSQSSVCTKSIIEWRKSSKKLRKNKRKRVQVSAERALCARACLGAHAC